MLCGRKKGNFLWWPEYQLLQMQFIYNLGKEREMVIFSYRKSLFSLSRSTYKEKVSTVKLI